MKGVAVELKVCEGCGGLWIRASGSGVYCRGCALWLSEFPAPKGRSRCGRKPKVERQAVRKLACAGGAQ